MKPMRGIWMRSDLQGETQRFGWVVFCYPTKWENMWELMEEILNNHQGCYENPCKIMGYSPKKTGAGFLPLTTVGDVL